MKTVGFDTFTKPVSIMVVQNLYLGKEFKMLGVNEVKFLTTFIDKNLPATKLWLDKLWDCFYL